jgi:ribosome-binding factor A
MAASRRQRQVAELLHEEISQLIQFRSRDPRLGFITVTGVDVSPDLRLAHVYVTVLGDDTDTQSALEGLTNASGYFQHQLGQSLSLRYIPKLIFKLDTSLEQGMRIDSLLDSIRENPGDSNPSEPPSELGTDDEH